MNHCLLEIRVKKAPTVRYTQDNKTPIAEFEAIFDALRPDAPPSTIKVVGWGRMAEELQQKVKVNQKFIVEGRLRMNTIPRQDGTKEKRAELTLSKLHFLSQANIQVNETNLPTSSSENSELNKVKSSEKEKIGWDSSPLIPDTDEIPF